MESHYEINVARRVGNGTAYSHLFATAPRSCMTKESAQRVLRELQAKFPQPEYDVMLAHVNCVGHIIDMDKFLEAKS
jgi:hypothetical protein